MLKQTLTNTLQLGIPDITSLSLYVHTYTRLGILTQIPGSWCCLEAYLLKQLESHSWGLGPCLCVLQVTALFVSEADYLWDKNP